MSDLAASPMGEPDKGETLCESLRQNAKTRQDIHGFVAVKPDLLLIAATRIDLLTLALRQIADPSYVGNYNCDEVVNIYRSWATTAANDE